MESVWDYPRPPCVESCERPVRVTLAGETLAASVHALRVLETSHPPTIYVPPGDVGRHWLRESGNRPTLCEFKGRAQYLDAVIGERAVRAVGWTYRDPSLGYERLRDHVAFYVDRVDAAGSGRSRWTLSRAASTGDG